LVAVRYHGPHGELEGLKENYITEFLETGSPSPLTTDNLASILSIANSIFYS
jgi:hypothetical protein